ncbi:FimV/HubP family polar landmark protein [Burkholderia multivorans]|uniref:FimV/HubP family polar landmark protein n=8 Tax=Burkholderia multivorans TaxID=87883 RepID=UPI00057D6078|nr:FimV/HubP family polar landmark protein [Burkholderia multivorans]KHS19285.1 pilus assembly protein FimV [Burkholderia multivorans]KHS19697.1 pilus assembly protein FimV [Burkholderia multivorans]MBU9590939.1 pilus assembly protein FimV [Burkholderia multivorans]MCO8453163.1 pilus assembly protein FimV [Burkholderia multivorans]MCO8465592.1 pilus assembly protein FimV [Burkholderia multivorans]
MSRISLFPRRSRLSRAVCGALAVLALGTAASTWAAGTGDAPAPAVASGNPAPLTVTVQPGQSLNDIAIAATQSHDPAVLARAGRALFDANPQAFMKRDPSRLKVGATLTVPALDASGAAVAAGASAPAAASAAASAAAASGAAAAAQHAASAAHGASAAAAAAPIQHPAASGVAHGASAPAGASFVAPSSDAAAARGASAADTASAAAAAAGASGPHMWSGTIQPAPSSASDATAQSSQYVQPTSGAHAPAGAAPAAAASQPRPSSLQQLLALKNRVLMELQKHGIGKPAATTAPVAPAPTAPVTPRAPDDAGASSAAAASGADAASGTAASAASAPSVQASAPVVATPPANRGEPIDWRPAALAGAAVVVLAGGLVWRKRRKHRHAEAVAAGSADDASPSAEQALPIEPETPVSRDVVSDVNFAAVASAAAEAVAPTNEVASTPEAAKPEESNREASNREAAKPEATNLEAANPEASNLEASNREAANREPTSWEATNREAAEPQASNLEAANPEPKNPLDDRPQPSSSTLEPVHPTDGAPLPHDAKPAFDAEPSAPLASSVPVADAAASSTTDPQHAALMQNAITALGSLDMPLPPRAAGETSSSSDDAEATLIATNGQTAPRPPVGANDTSTEHRADHEDELEWDDDAPHADTSARPAAPSPLSPLGGAQFGALKLDFDLDLPSAPGAELPALTPEELARIARNKLDLAAEYVELGDLSGARTLLQEVVDANDAATRDDARAMLAKLSEDA